MSNLWGCKVVDTVCLVKGGSSRGGNLFQWQYRNEKSTLNLTNWKQTLSDLNVENIAC